MRRPRPYTWCLAWLGLLAATGCASIINGKKQKVRIETVPPGAELRVLPDDLDLTSPADVQLERLKVHTVFVRCGGYRDATAYIDRVTSGWIYGNLLVGGMIGLSTDASTGGAFRLTPDEVRVVLEPLGADLGACIAID